MREYFVWLAKLVTLVLVVGLGFLTLVGTVAAVGAASNVSKNKDNKVAVVELKGVIMDSREVVEELHKQAADNSVKGIVLRVDSPGGAVGPSQEVYYAVKALKGKKPIVVSMGSLAASGGLYASLGASKIFALPGTITGSIGVIMQIPNLTDIADKVGFQMITIKSGKLKDVGNTFRKMAPEEQAYLEDSVRLSHEDFIAAVAEGRKLDREKVVKFADGRILLGTQAKDLGLVDAFGDTYDAARSIFEILGEPLPATSEPYLVYPNDKYQEFKKFLESVISVPAILSPNSFPGVLKSVVEVSGG